MALTQLVSQFKMLSGAAKVALAVAVLVVIGAIVGGVHWYNHNTIIALTKQQEKLREDGQQKTDEYNRKIGEAHAKELAAREDKQKSDAMVAEYQQRVGNIKALDQKLDKAEAGYEKAKAELGDCGETIPECQKKLCLELQKAGFKVKCD